MSIMAPWLLLCKNRFDRIFSTPPFNFVLSKNNWKRSFFSLSLCSFFLNFNLWFVSSDFGFFVQESLTWVLFWFCVIFFQFFFIVRLILLSFVKILLIVEISNNSSHFPPNTHKVLTKLCKIQKIPYFQIL